MFRGLSIGVDRIDGDIAELQFDRRDGEVNKFDVRTIDELKAATSAIAAAAEIRGVLVTSTKPAFIVGADVFEFRALFAKSAADIAAFNAGQSAAFSVFEDLPVPIVVAINGLALGGGFEMALAADCRVMADAAQVGLPEVSLGIFPGFGGTVRLPRLCGAPVALEWITSGKPRSAADAVAAGAVDRVVPAGGLRAAALATLREVIASADWRSRRVARREAAPPSQPGALETLKGRARAIASHYPAALAAIELVEATAGLDRDAALAAESAAFGAIAKTGTARALVQVFVNDQALKRRTKAIASAAGKVRRAAVLGAGIMGGGIAYTSAARGVAVLMKDVMQGALDLGTREAGRLLDRQVQSGRLTQEKAAAVQAAIVPTLSYDDFAGVDVVVEAIVENLDIKEKVLPEVEARVGPATVIASNTSSLSIDELAGVLQRPENFVGMHFFNPVPVMPLVEIIRGERTSEAAVATIVGYATAMGKTPVVLRDCPGFLVNRVLNAYYFGFAKLICDGANFERVDAAMEGYGWPMGPAYLEDVIGIDTGSHVFEIIAAAYPNRMALGGTNPMHLMAEHRRYGQKNGAGFYRYEKAANGRLTKLSAPEAHALLAACQPGGRRDFADEEIVDRMMIPMVLEAARCLEERVAEGPAEIDMALVLGLGFPRHHCGALAYADALGLDTLLRRCEHYGSLGPAYAAPALVRNLASSGRGFYT
jgi:3-hydroxyacyl-CoA dehydrogenase/enoyl-CoA hydratase/3-hydroxybutyryl-CoA epimerase/enoyl-CoA isomerase